MAVLVKERKTYEAQKPTLLAKHSGQFALVHGGDLVGTYTTFAEAYTEGVTRFGLDAFLVQEIREDDPRAQHPALDVGAIITR